MLPDVTQRDGRIELLFIGDDWAEGHHDVVAQDDAGKTLAGGGCRKGRTGSPGSTS